MAKPRFLDDPAFKSLRSGDVAGYHHAIESRATVDFSGADLCATDFRKADLSKLILRGAYLRDADFRGCDLRHLDLEGASLHSAKVAGTYFPANVSVAELQMSFVHGTRIRTQQP